jgi:putative NIF3 family GTP cyclohydrolase 1 type 2
MIYHCSAFTCPWTVTAIDGEITGAEGGGFRGKNSRRYSLETMLVRFRQFLFSDCRPDAALRNESAAAPMHPLYSFRHIHGFGVFQNGPEIPQNIAIISGGGAGEYERAVGEGIDTFICGEPKEQVPAISHETATNFIYLGHYNSEKPGVWALQDHLEKVFSVETEYIEFANSV